MELEIVKLGNSALRRKAKKVEQITPELQELATSMIETMYKANGVGLAAEQVGRTEAMCVIDVPPESQGSEYVELQSGIKMPMVLINPVVSEREGSQRGSEGCLSVPSVYAQVTRALSCRVDWMGLDGKHYSAKVYGLLARAVQHECDHLEGKVFVDMLSAAQLLLLKNKISKIKRAASTDEASQP